MKESACKKQRSIYLRSRFRALYIGKPLEYQAVVWEAVRKSGTTHSSWIAPPLRKERIEARLLLRQREVKDCVNPSLAEVTRLEVIAFS